MALPRRSLLGWPHTYALGVRTALGAPILRKPAVLSVILEHMERCRTVFGLRIYALAVTPESLRLVIAHRAEVRVDESTLIERWSTLGPRSNLRGEALRERMTNLSGIMQTLLGTLSRRVNRVLDNRGSIWASRYRSCLLTDHAGLLAATAGCNHHQIGGIPPFPTKTPLPLTEMWDGQILPQDEAPVGVLPPEPQRLPELTQQILHEIPETDYALYAHAIDHSWALGRMESLTETIGRLGRHGGRGRSRRPRDLEDELGIWGVWG